MVSVSVYKVLLPSVIIFCILVNFMFHISDVIRSQLFFSDSCMKSLLNRTAYTEKGILTYHELLLYLYEPMGYKMKNVDCDHFTGFFPLMKKDLICQLVFRDWMKKSDDWSQFHANHTGAPPEKFPDKDLLEYTMSNFVKLSYNYRNDLPMSKDFWDHHPWRENFINVFTNKFKARNFTNVPYYPECIGLFNAFRHFPVVGQTGIIIGSGTPWVEAMALYNGAKKVFTSEYSPLNISYPGMEYIHPYTLAKKWLSFQNVDFVASFSSIEHSGLGRYGDPFDPLGDLREMEKILCLLRDGGIAYIGIPTGYDQLVYNVHRVYGSIRWPVIAAGFKFLGSFYGNNEKVSSAAPEGSRYNMLQHVVVLQK